MQFISMLNAFALRMTHAGQVSSGDFLAAGASSDGFMVESGWVLKNLAIGVAVLFIAIATMAMGFFIGKFVRVEHDS